jgi:hypothetical protein
MYATSTRTRKFGTDDQRDRFAAKYGSADYATVGRAIAAAQPSRQEATVNQFVKPNEGSIATLHSLSASRTPWVPVAAINKWLETASAADVAAKVDWLETQPVAQRNEVQDQPLRKRTAQPNGQNVPVEVPAGRYAVTGEDGTTKFYRVDRPTEGRWVGYVFVKVQAGDDLYNVYNRQARNTILAKIAADGVQEAMLRYGREIGNCGHCGRTLTNEESRAAGIGPVCRGKMGW